MSNDISIYIDEAGTLSKNAKNPHYLIDYFRGRLKRPSYCKTEANIYVEYKDSNKYRSIQICDILANCKYNHYVHGRKEIDKAFQNIVQKKI